MLSTRNLKTCVKQLTDIDGDYSRLKKMNNYILSGGKMNQLKVLGNINELITTSENQVMILLKTFCACSQILKKIVKVCQSKIEDPQSTNETIRDMLSSVAFFIVTKLIVLKLIPVYNVYNEALSIYTDTTKVYTDSELIHTFADKISNHPFIKHRKFIYYLANMSSEFTKYKTMIQNFLSADMLETLNTFETNFYGVWQVMFKLDTLQNDFMQNADIKCGTLTDPAQSTLCKKIDGISKQVVSTVISELNENMEQIQNEITIKNNNSEPIDRIIENTQIWWQLIPIAGDLLSDYAQTDQQAKFIATFVSMMVDDKENNLIKLQEDRNEFLTISIFKISENDDNKNKCIIL